MPVLPSNPRRSEPQLQKSQVMICFSNERVALFFRFAATLIVAAATGAVSPVSAQSAAPTVACVAPPEFTRFNNPLKRVAERISASQPLTIVAIGSSSTFGAGASSPAMSYPSRLAFELRALLPRTLITVINRGVNGETARDMLARFDRDVFAVNPDLVLWQVGSNSVLLGRPIAPTGLLISEGLRRLKVAGSDVVLINPQYAPKVIAMHDEHDVDQMVTLISAAAREMNIDLFQRFALMRLPAPDGRPPVQRFPVEGRTPHERLELWLYCQASCWRDRRSRDAREGAIGHVRIGSFTSWPSRAKIEVCPLLPQSRLLACCVRFTTVVRRTIFSGQVLCSSTNARERSWASEHQPINYKRCCTDRLSSQG